MKQLLWKLTGAQQEIDYLKQENQDLLTDKKEIFEDALVLNQDNRELWSLVGTLNDKIERLENDQLGYDSTIGVLKSGNCQLQDEISRLNRRIEQLFRERGEALNTLENIRENCNETLGNDHA